MKKTIAILAIMLPLAALAKPAYKITLQIDGSKDSSILICYYHAQNRYILDTAYNNGRGKFVFEGEKELMPGLYFFTNNADRYAEFVVYKEKPVFQFHTDNRNWITNMRIKGSQQNELFYNYQRASEILYMELDEAKRTLDSAALADFTHRQHLRIDTLKSQFIERHPDAMFAKMMNATRNVDEEVPTTKADGSKLTDRERYEWFMQHYFDYIPLDDDFIVGTPKPVFYQHVMDYVDKYMRGLPPEMVCPLLDSIIDRSEAAPEVFKWLVLNLTEKYLQSTVMVYDEVYVHLVKRYFATGKVTFLSPSTIDEQIQRANKWEPLLVGREAPELILFDTMRRVHSLHHMPGRYTLLLFWSPTCGHCREIIPGVYKVFERYADSLDLSAFAILTEPEEGTVQKWKDFLKEHHINHSRWINLNGGEANVDWREVYDISTTPQIYLIDNKDHKFAAKKLNASIFEQICEQLKQ